MKIAFFSPLNPVQSGISDYSEELLAALAGARVDGRPLDLDLFVDRGYRPANHDLMHRFPVRPGRTFGRVAAHYDAVVYQMGNSPAHAYIYRALLAHPGVVVLHEFILHHLRIWMALNRGERRAYEELMARQYGAAGREAARRVLLGQFPEALFQYPLSDEVIARATGIVVHSAYMAGLVRGVRPDVPLTVVPMGVPLPPRIPRREARARLGLDPDLFLVTSIGHLNPYKRVPATLRAFKALLMEVPHALYLLVGSRSPNYDPLPQIEMLGLEDKVRLTGYVAAGDLPYYLAASDVCLNLRSPTAGETSAALLRVMGAGVPVLVSRTGAFVELPDAAAGKVDVGDGEEELLLEYLLLLARRPDVRRAMATAARAYVATQHTLEGAARGYLEFLVGLPGAHGPEPATIDVPALPPAAAPPPAQPPARGPIAVASPDGAPNVLPTSAPPRPPSDLLPATVPALVGEAAAELGLTEDDVAVLLPIARALEGLVPARGTPET